MAAALLAGSVISGGSNIAASLGSTGLQSYTSLKLQQNEQSYNQKIMSTATKAYTDAGLPKYMAFSGNSGGFHLPGQQYHVTGSNFYSAGLVGQSVPFLSTPYQAFTHTGRPNNTVNQQDTGRRAGLGQYSQVRPWNEPQNFNELGDLTYRNMPINRAFMNQLNNANNNQEGQQMNRMPRTNYTRTYFQRGLPMQNFVRGTEEVAQHQQAARALQ